MFKSYIIGYPLKKPRSVFLWRSFFKKKKIESSMQALEVKKNKLRNFINQIKSSNNFLASAVTTPLKQEMFKLIMPGNKISGICKSVNFIIKKNNKVFGYNTDILALLKIIKIKKKKNILILGLGGVGMPLANVLGSYRNFEISAVSSKNIKIKNVKIYDNIKKINLSNIEMIINCTPLGSSLSSNYLNKIPISESILDKLNKNIFIYDIIYSPKKNRFFKEAKIRKLNYQNGIQMNTIQADIALEIIENFVKKSIKKKAKL